MKAFNLLIILTVELTTKNTTTTTFNSLFVSSSSTIFLNIYKMLHWKFTVKTTLSTEHSFFPKAYVTAKNQM